MGDFLQRRLWAQVQRYFSSGKNINTMLLTKFVIVSKVPWYFVNHGEIVIKSELVPRKKDTLAPLVIKMLKQRFWQIF